MTVDAPTLQAQLWSLHLVDQHLRGLRGRMDSAGRRKIALQKKLDQTKQKLAEIDASYKSAQTQARALEGEANELKAKVESIRDKVSTVTSNKEYSAMLVEMNTFKADQSKLEEEALTHLTKAEEIEETLKEHQATLAEQQKLVDAAGQEVEEAREEISDKLTELEDERKRTAEPIDADALALYNKLADSFDGEALAEVEEQNRRRMEYSCGACFTHLPIERVNVVLSRPQELVVCPSCDRILVCSQKLRTDLAPES